MTENKTKITIAIIGLIGILGGAFFANWDKIFQPQPAPITPMPVNGENKPDRPHEPPHEPPPNNEQAEISQRIEVLRRDLEENERAQMRVREEMDHIRPMLETDSDLPPIMKQHEMYLDELEMDRIRVQREFDYLNEQLQENHN